jgi:hypothetical protein
MPTYKITRKNLKEGNYPSPQMIEVKSNKLSLNDESNSLKAAAELLLEIINNIKQMPL